MSLKHLLFVFIFLILYLSGCNQGIMKKSDNSYRAGGTELTAENFRIKLGEIKYFAVSKHIINISYLSNSPSHSLNIIIDGKGYLVDIPKTECLITNCKTCYKLNGREECSNEPSICIWVGKECSIRQSYSKPEMPEPQCKSMTEQADCRYDWKQDDLEFFIKPLIINDNNYYRNNWSADLLEFEVIIRNACPNGQICSQ